MSEADLQEAVVQYLSFAYPPRHFGLYNALAPLIGSIAEIRYDSGFPALVVNRMAYANGVLVDLVTDDELGLIGASPEERVRLALAIRESCNV